MALSFLTAKGKKKADLERALIANSIELTGEKDIDVLVDKIGACKYVLLGEASHGTHEYYTWRAQISKRLIEQKGFSFIAVEGDWPDCYRINRYIKNYLNAGKNALSFMQDFRRWPTWLWSNWEVVALTEWLRTYNNGQRNKVGFYGLDVYSLWESFEAIIQYLDKEDPATKQTAMKALRCFEPYRGDEGKAYARATFMVPPICEDQVLDLLIQVRKNMTHYDMDPESVLSTEQNAHVIVDAEKYYRTMMHPGPDSWNIRDYHMVSTLSRLMQFHGPSAKAIVWEHNTHIGDARATGMAEGGLINVGQLIHQQHSKDGVFAVGFGTDQGQVIAGYEWGDEMRTMDVPEAKAGSWEHFLHELGAKDRIIFMDPLVKAKMRNLTFEHRAIGVVYDPRYEANNNYVPSLMGERYNAFIYLDSTSALHPLATNPDSHQLPETFPFGI